MLISLDWIKEFVDIKETCPKTIGEKFTLATAEVEEVEVVNECFDQIKIAEITQIEGHPDADKLNLVTFNYGEAETKRVVCGASNVRVGLKTPFAPIGVTLPNGLTLESRPIRGVVSDGMLCSEEELGFQDSSDGIMELPEDSIVGTPLSEYFALKADVIIDVDNKSLTHRPDLWGHYGLSREFAAVFDSELKNPFHESWEKELLSKIGEGEAPIKVKVHQGSAGKAYFGLSVDGISVSESPSWMQTRLKAVGLRPINSIVDISNYVMLELGIPNHIFDRDQIKGDTVIIKSLESDETFTTLDEIERKLISGDTVISDDEKTLVIGGLMGGLNSGVTESTNRIFIEVANWVPSMVRKTSTRLGLRTDSSQRYEKSLDSQLLKRTLLRILELIIELNPEAKVNGSLSYDGENLSDFSPLVMNLDPHRVRTELGHEVSDDQMKSILSSLDFKVEDSSEGFKVTIPSYRSTKDIDCSADLIEEIGRVIGYDNITPSSPMLDITPVNLTPTQKLHRRIKNFCVLSGGFYELQTYPMVGHDLLKKAHWNAKEGHLELINALSKDASLMRDSLIPSHLEVIAKNVKNYSQFKCFEVGRIYKPNDKNFVNEETQLILLQYSETASPFVELSNSVEELFSECSMPAAFVDSHPKFKSEVVDENWEGVHPHEFSNIRLMGKFKGVVFSLHPWLLRQFKIKGHVSLCVLNLGDVEARPAKDKVKYTPLAKFPKSSFDWTVLANKDEPVGNLLKSLSKVKIKNLVETKVADVYQLNDEQKSVTLRATFLDPEKTLDGDFLSGARDQLVSALDKAGYPLKV